MSLEENRDPRLLNVYLRAVNILPPTSFIASVVTVFYRLIQEIAEVNM